MTDHHTKTPAPATKASKDDHELTEKDLEQAAGGTTGLAGAAALKVTGKKKFVDGGVESVDNWMDNA